jgi:RimJ/RimL family protein N-acetyltransferase
MTNDLRVRLRQFAIEDAGAVHRWFNSSKATSHLIECRDSFSMADALVWTERAAARGGDDRKFAIEVQGVGGPVGFTALYGLSDGRTPELGILVGDRVAPGVGRRAEALTIALAFEVFDAHRVYGLIRARNRAAKWVVESLGWMHEATLRGHIRRPDGSVEDCEVWGVLPEDFAAATQEQ